MTPESRRSTQSYVFHREKLETGSQLNDFTKSPPVFLAPDREKKLAWVVEINGFKLQPINITTKNADGSSRNEDNYISVDNSTVGYNKTYFFTTKDGKKGGEITTITINRLTGELVGANQLYGSDNQFHTEIQGKCAKASLKF